MGEEMMNEEKSVAENLIKAFDLQDENGNNDVTLRIVSVGTVATIHAKKGFTIADLIEDNGYDYGTKITDKTGVPLRDDYVINSDMDLYLSVPKSNG